MKAKLSVLSCMLAVAGLTSPLAQAQEKVKIGFVTDMSSLYADVDGKNGAIAMQMAIEDFGGKALGQPIEFMSADHQNKADIAASKMREWIDTQNISLVFSGTNSGTALAVSQVANEKKRVHFNNGAGSSALTNEQCNPYTVHYVYDTVALAKGTGGAVVDRGGKDWFFLTADYAFGQALESDTTKVIQAKGGKVLGSVKHPLSSSDFSSFLLQAQSSKAEILALANAGADATNAIKAANEFGLTKTMKLAGLIMFINDIHAMGLPATQGMYLTDSWYWNSSDAARAWSREFFKRHKSMPSSLQAADYSAALQYLRAVKATGTDDADKVLAYLRANKLNDLYLKDGVVRPDGRVVHDMYLLQVKTPEQSKEPWDYFNVVQTIDGNEAFTKQSESRCALWK